MLSHCVSDIRAMKIISYISRACLRISYNNYGSINHHSSTLRLNNYGKHQVMPGFKNLSTSTVDNNQRCYVPFEKMLENRRDEAQRSILIQVHSGYSYQDLKNYCKQFGALKNALYYTTSEDMHFILVEFTDKKSVDRLMKFSSYGTTTPIVPVQSPFLWFRATDKSSKQHQTSETPPEPISDLEPSTKTLQLQIQEADTISEQIQILYDSTHLKDLGSRLRFLTARQLETALSGIFPHAQVLPFGSSVNGFGLMGCDLDLVLQLGGYKKGGEEEDEHRKSARLIFHGKTNLACNGRVQVQRYMETIAELLHLFLPGCSRVIRILQARVPIIKFRQDIAQLDCDLSMTNMTALYMSELLYVYGEADPRVRPLVFCVRHWAKATGLTNSSPGSWITNFSLTLMTLFFLQVRSPQVLPSLNTLIQLAGDTDRRITEEGINCTFLRDLSNLAYSTNEENLEELLISFFEFYASFDFGTKGISLTNGKPVLKPEHAPLFIENPLERNLNVSKNVSSEELLRMQIEFRNAAWLIEQQMDETKRNQSWGLTMLLSNFKSHGLSTIQAKSHRLVYMKDLFSNSDDDKKLLQQQNRAKNTVRYKRR